MPLVCTGAACVVPFRMACGIHGSGEVHYSCRLARELTAAAGLGVTHLSGDTGPGGFGRHVGQENNNSEAMFTKMKREYKYFNDFVKKF